MKKQELKKKIAIATTIAITLITIIIAYIIFIPVFNVKKTSDIMDAENLRAKKYKELDEQDYKTDSDYVEFAAFFLRDIDEDGNANPLDGTCKKTSGTDTLYMEIKVNSKGHLKEGATITINGDNFNYKTAIVKDPIISEDYISNNTKSITLNQIQNGTQKLIYGEIVANIGNDISKYSSDINTVTLSGTYVGENGDETTINKTMNLTVDWYGEVHAEIPYSYAGGKLNTLQNNKFEDIVITDSEASLTFTVATQETEDMLLLKESHIEGTVPNLNGYTAKNVKIEGTNVEYTWDEKTQEFTATRKAILNATNNIPNIDTQDTESTSATKITMNANSGRYRDNRYNEYKITVTYPIEAYDLVNGDTINLNIPVSTYYLAYTNKNEEFNEQGLEPGIIKSNVVSSNIIINYSIVTEEEYNFYIDVGEYIKSPIPRYVVSKEKALQAYNGIQKTEEKDYYTVRWTAVRGTGNNIDKIVMKEPESNPTDKFKNTKNESTDMTEKANLKNVGIYFSDPTAMLGEEGFINVYEDGTNHLIHKFTRDDWNSYTELQPFYFDEPIEHIKIETSSTNENSTLSVYNVKEIDDNALKGNVERTDFDDITNILSNLKGIVYQEENEIGSVSKENIAQYEDKFSYFETSINNNTISTQDIAKNQVITIKTIADEYNEANWKNAVFLIKLPEEIINVKINSIKSDSENVKVIAHDLYMQDDNYFIKILTQNEQETTYSLTVDCDFTPNPIAITNRNDLYVYAYNEFYNNYYYTEKDSYDINLNENVEDYVAKTATTIQFISPSLLITTETITDYNDQIEDEETISPNVAEITKEQRTANVNIKVSNNYSSTIDNTKILGKIAYKDNTYVTNTQKLGSQFTVKMNNKGIILPEELKDVAKVYYSTNPVATEDLGSSQNAWITQEKVEDFSNIKMYLIDFGNYKIPARKTYTISYGIDIPQGIEYNKEAYSIHTISFSLGTNEGEYVTKTESGKVGLRIARKYKLKLAKFKKGSDTTKVPNSTYKITAQDDKGNEISVRTLTTNSSGNISLDELYVNVEYKIQEVKSATNYELSDEVFAFKVVEDEDGNLKIEKESDNITFDEEKEEVQITAEDEPKFKLVIKKIDGQTNKELSGINFSLNEKLYITNQDGVVTMQPLQQNTEYTLKEVYANGYYLMEDINFKLTRDEQGHYSVTSNNADFTKAAITNPDDEDLINVNVTLTNEKIPTFKLQVLKVAEDNTKENTEEMEKLDGVKFLLTSNDTKIQKEYVTDKNGLIEIDDLYQYVDGKNITGKYTLQEIEPKSGYANVGEEINFKVSRQTNGELLFEIDNENELISLRSKEVNNNVAKLVIQNRPLFKLTKTDEDGNLLKNVQFIIYEIDKDGNVIDFAKDAKGDFVGERTDDGSYVVETDENGVIMLPLRDGTYRIIEVSFPEGYVEEAVDEIFKVEGKSEDDREEEPSNVYDIDSIEDLIKFSDDVNKGNDFSSVTVRLLNDLDFDEIGEYENYNFTPIGKNQSYPFSGTFDGKNHEIRNLYINTSADINSDCYVGLFGYVINGNIKNVGITGSITNSGSIDCTGGIVAYMEGNSMINCYNMASVRTLSSNNMSRQNTGGLIGCAENICIENCYNTGPILGNSFEMDYTNRVGGIVGSAIESNINGCYNTGDIRGDECVVWPIVGGIVAACDNTMINKCYNTGTIDSFCYAGGITGLCENNFCSIKNCHNNGLINANGNFWESYAGGIVGYYQTSNMIVENCYNIGDLISYTSNLSPSGTWKGAIISRIGLHVETSNNYYLEGVNEKGDIGYMGTKMTDEQMKTKDFYSLLNKDNVWVYIKDSYPKLSKEIPADLKQTTELTVQNTLKTFNVTTDVNEINGIRGGNITGEGETPYETISYGKSNKETIKMTPQEGYRIYSITINGKEIEYKIENDGTYTIPVNYFQNVNEDKHIVVTYTYAKEDSKLIINKVDKETNIPIPGVKFAIYSTDLYGNTIAQAKDSKGDYIGEHYKDVYAVTTDENGKIELVLPSGYYKAVEIEAPIGYAIEENEDERTTYFNTKSDLVIDSIEDLVKFSDRVNKGETFEGKIVELARNLDFNDINSYENANDTETFGDYNGDKNVQTIKEEITSVRGFRPIGTNPGTPFKGTFDGNGYEIKNIYVNVPANYSIGLFGTIDNGTVANIGLTGNINSSGSAIGGIIGVLYGGNNRVINCYNSVNITTTGSYIGGVVGFVSSTTSIIKNCYNTGTINCSGGSYVGGVVGYSTNTSVMENCYNTGNISGSNVQYVAGIIGVVSNWTIDGCYNKGNITNNSAYSTGIAGYVTNSTIFNVYNEGTVTGYGPASGITYEIDKNSIICNSYNLGNVTSSNAPATGISFAVVDSEICNSYNAGKINSSSYTSYAITCGAGNATFKKCYYLDGSAKYGNTMSNGVEALAAEKMRSQTFADTLNKNIKEIETEKSLSNWQHSYSNNEFPELNNKYYEHTTNSKDSSLPKYEIVDSEIIIKNQRKSIVTVHHYLEGTGPEEGNSMPAVELADDEVIQGKEGEEYTTSPKMNLQNYTLIKDENGKFKTPTNASGKFSKNDIDVYYYYNSNSLELVVHHYLVGTEQELAEDEHSEFTKDEPYTTSPSEKLKEMYEVVDVVGEPEGTMTESKEVTYFYKKKRVKITTRIEVPEGRAEKGGTISGEGDNPYEYVDYGDDSTYDIIAIPDVGYKIEKITANGKPVPFTMIGQQIQLDKFTNMTEDIEVVVSFVTTGGRVITHHYIEGTTEKVHGDIINEDRLGAIVKTSPVYVDGYKYVDRAGEMDDDGNVIITKTVEEGAHEVIYYYQKCSIITTDVIEHTEKYKDGTINEKVKGGTITDEDVVIHEMIVGDGSNEKTIEMTPTRDEIKEYEIVRIVINGEEYDFTSEDSELKVDEEGKITIPKGFFKNVQGNIHVEVEFRRKSKVIVKYKDKSTGADIIEPTEIVGHADDEYTTYPKVIPGYEVIEDEITDEKGNKTNANGNMFSDDVTVTYWYNKVEGSVIERHIAINYKGEEKEIDYKSYDLESEENITTQRKDSKKYVPIDAPDAVKQEFKEKYKNIILVEKGANEYTVKKEEIAEDSDVIEVWYYYSIKNFNITTEVRKHTEKVVDPSTNEKQDVLIDGGTISGQDDEVYEIVEYGEKSKNEIVITPEPKYVVKQVILESTNEDEEKTTTVIYDKYQDKNQEQNKKKEITVVQNEDGTISLRNTKNSDDNSYIFENVTENKHIIVEFEKRKTKVFVKYVDVDTKEEIESEDMEGFIDDEYKTSEKEYENYVLAEPYPENAQGNFAEEDTTVTYYYTKQFNITTDVKEHNEDSEKNVVDVTTENVENDDKVEGGQILVKGGTISGDDEALYEKVNRGLDNTKEVVIAPDQGYRIKYVKIEEAGNVVEELTMDELVEKGLVKDDGTVVLPAGYFKNMQADKHIVVEFERIPAKVVVKFVDKDTGEEISEQLVKDGFVNDDYRTHEKQIPYFELIQEELPQNAEGKLEEETVVTYLYKKLNFNMKLTKELSSVCVNGNDIEVQSPKLVKVDLTKSELQSANILAKYKITVTNTEKVAGIAKVIEQIPEGFKPSSQMNITKLENTTTDQTDALQQEDTTATEQFDIWQQTEEGLALTTRELQPGETAEYEVILEWDAGLGIIGTLDNVAKITETQNVPEFAETTLEDNEDSCTVLLTVKTGGREIAIAVLCFTLVGVCAMVCVKATVDYRKRKNK